MRGSSENQRREKRKERPEEVTPQFRVISFRGKREEQTSLSKKRRHQAEKTPSIKEERACDFVIFGKHWHGEEKNR